MEKTKNQQQVWQEIVQQETPEACSAAAKEALAATRFFGWSLIVIVSIIFVFSLGLIPGELSPTEKSVFPALYASAFIFLGFKHNPILRFIPATANNYFFKMFLFAMTGVGAIIVWDSAMRHAKKAARNIESTILSLDRRTISTHGFEEWKACLDLHLENSNSSIRHNDFKETALEYGYANHMTPAAFLTTGYDQSLHEGQFQIQLEMDNLIAKTQEESTEPISKIQGNSMASSAFVQSNEDHNPASHEPKNTLETNTDLESLFKLYNSGAITLLEFQELKRARVSQ